MDSDAQVRLVFAGEVLAGFDRDEVKRRFGESFKLTKARLDDMFTGGRTVLKRSLTAEEAERYVRKLRKMGLGIEVEPMSAEHPGAVVPAAPLAIEPTPAPKPVAPLPMVPMPPIPGKSSAGSDFERPAPRRGTEGDTDRYAPPRAQVGYTSEATDEPAPIWSLSFEGRMGRLTYFNAGVLGLVGVAAAGIGAAIVVPSTGSLAALVPFGVAFVVFLLWSLRVTALRLHDFNRSGWWSLLFVIPYLGWGSIGSLVLMFWPGTDGDNDYGGQPRRGNALLAIGIGVLVVGSMIASVGSYRTYVKRVRQAEQAQSQPGVDPLFAQQAAQRLASPLAQKVFADDYVPAGDHKAFAASDSGAWGWRAGQASAREAATQALSACEANRKPYTGPCKLVAVDAAWVSRP